MSKQVKLRRGTATEHASFTGVVGEITVDTTNKTIRVHDGATVGGKQLAKADGTNASGTWGIGISGNAATATTAGACSGNAATATYATSAGSATSATNATNSTNATNATNSTTQAVSDDSTKIATTAFVHDVVGDDQTWQNMAASRALNTDYTNTTGRKISVSFASSGSAGYTVYRAIVDGVAISETYPNAGGVDIRTGPYFDVPAGSVYSITVTSGSMSIGLWAELR